MVYLLVLLIKAVIGLVLGVIALHLVMDFLIAIFPPQPKKD